MSGHHRGGPGNRPSGGLRWGGFCSTRREHQDRGQPPSEHLDQNGGRSVPVFASPARSPSVNAVLTVANNHHRSGDTPSGRPKSAFRAATIAEPAVARRNPHANPHRVSRRRATSTMSSDREN